MNTIYVLKYMFIFAKIKYVKKNKYLLKKLYL